MDITDGETMGGDGLPGPASRKLQGKNNQKRKSGTGNLPVGQTTPEERKSGKKTRPGRTSSGLRPPSPQSGEGNAAAAGVEVQVHLVTPEKQSALEAVLGPSLPVTGKPRAKGKTFKSAGAKILVLVSLTAAGLGLSIGLGHASSHNIDGSHKTVQVQTSARREEVGGQVLPDGAGEKRKAESENRKEDHGLQTTDHEDGAGGEQETQTRDGSILAKLDEVSSALARLEQYLPGFTPKPAASPASGSHGRLQWANDFKEIRLGGVLYNLEKRKKARYCIQYLVESAAFCEKSARHLENEIDPYVRAQAKMEPLRESSKDNLRIQHYFVGTGKNFRQLYAEVIKSAGNGRFYLHTK